LTIKINNRYKLSKEYLDSLTVKPCTDLVTVNLMYGDVVNYSDGKTTFTDRIVNIVPHLQEPDFRFNTTSVKKPESVAPVSTPENPDPNIPDPVPTPQPTTPVITPTDPAPSEPTTPQDNTVTPDPVPDPEPQPSGNPYDDNYL